MQVAEAGGNSVRVWVHVEGDSRWVIMQPVFVVREGVNFGFYLNYVILCSPYWDSDGFTLGTDEAGDTHYSLAIIIII